MEELVDASVAFWVVLVYAIVAIQFAVTFGGNTVVEGVLASVVTASHSPDA